MHDSPFRVRVGGRDEADPLAVIADGAGLKGGETGQKLEYIINTCNSGTGTLDVSWRADARALNVNRSSATVRAK
jgi:filamin